MKPKFTKDIFYISTIALLIALSAQFYYSYRYAPGHQISVYYNHDNELNKEVINIIRNADKFVYFAIYTFTKADIKDALLAAKYRGLTVIGITDRDQMAQIDSQKKIIDELKTHGIPVYQQDHAGIMHFKTVVTEKAYASGSYNWTQSATNLNDEVLEVSSYEPVRKQYQQVMEELFFRYGNK